MKTVRWFLPGLVAVLIAGCGEKPKVTTSSPGALQWYEKGVSLFERFYYREALEAIDSAIAADSTFTLAWVRRAVIDSKTGNQEAAQKEIARAVALSGGASRSEQMQARMWLYLIRYDQRKAADVADSLIGAYPSLREAYLVRGQLYEWEKNNEAAIRMYERAVAMDSTDAQAVMSIGYAYSNLGDVSEAIEYMGRYIRLLPHEADPRASFGDVLLRAGRYDEALEQYKASLVINPEYWYSMRRMAEVYTTLGRLKLAEAYFDTSLSLMPASPQVKVLRRVIAGRLDYERADYRSAAEKFQNALSLDSTSGEAAFNLDITLLRLGDIDAAERLNEGIRAEILRQNRFESPSRTAYELMVARTFRERGKFDEALAACDRALQYSIPLTRAAIFRERAEIYRRAGQYEPALDACEEALSFNSNSPEVLMTLVRVYHAEKNVDMTVEIGSRLLALWSEADPDFRSLQELQEIIGKAPHAGR